MSDRRVRLALLGLLAALHLAAAAHARATQKFGPLQLSGNLQT
jgi:hypothetical protein